MRYVLEEEEHDVVENDAAPVEGDESADELAIETGLHGGRHVNGNHGMYCLATQSLHIIKLTSQLSSTPQPPVQSSCSKAGFLFVASELAGAGELWTSI